MSWSNGAASGSSGRAAGKRVVERFYEFGLWAISVVALGAVAYAGTQGVGPGVRALLAFVVPVLWGAFIAAVISPTAKVDARVETAVTVLALVAVATVGAVLLFGAPVALATGALGVFGALLYVIWALNGSGGGSRPARGVVIWVRSLLILITGAALLVAVKL